MILYAGGKLADYTEYSRGLSLSKRGADALPWIILAIILIVIAAFVLKHTDSDKNPDLEEGLCIFIAFMFVWGLPLLLMILI